LTSAPVLHHFDPSLPTAVHIDGSQNAVGAVVLQWQENEDNTSPVAFMSRASYLYSASDSFLLAENGVRRLHKLIYLQKNENRSIKSLSRMKGNIEDVHHEISPKLLDAACPRLRTENKA